MATASKKSSSSSKPSSSSSSGSKSSHSGGSHSGSSHSSNSHSGRSHQSNNSGNNAGTILALAAGAVAGAGLALLLAPQSGSDTRRALKRTAQNLKDDLGNTLQQGMDKISTLVNGGSENDNNNMNSPMNNETGRLQTTIITGTIGTPGPAGTDFESGLGGI